MARPNVRYEVLPSEEQSVPAEPVAMAMVVPPPGYSENAVLEQEGDVPAYGPAKLPNYEQATTLPSYEEAERTKEQDAANAVSDCENGRLSDGISEMTIGTDGMFICTFLISFIFTWIGFLLSLCLSNTVAGRCGALSGLGLSIVKWVVIARHNKWGDNIADANSWLWWLLVLCGFLLFVRGSLQYVRVKYEWARMTGQVGRFRLM
ncbi:hypothetical protein RRG08_039663 [Elysia crispata]|uniref:Uncharacterized protein n=1 Tax=Elysia crispata TaxID=231223 RepID=A0AAE0YA92_9GAST|nr:hypothetical protein RRG08_039663 [Elysia crispata]